MVISTVGARPNFMKMAPIIHAVNKLGISNMLVHTGQHYDENMSKVFFDDLRMPDQEMPEEINRILTDQISDLLFVTEESGVIHSSTHEKFPSKYK